MTESSTPTIAALAASIEARLPGMLLRAPSLSDELCYEVPPDKLKEACLALRDSPELKFEILIDVAELDYLDYGTTGTSSSGQKTLRRTRQFFETDRRCETTQ